MSSESGDEARLIVTFFCLFNGHKTSNTLIQTALSALEGVAPVYSVCETVSVQLYIITVDKYHMFKCLNLYLYLHAHWSN